MRFDSKDFDHVRISAEDARAIDNLKQFSIGLWVKPDNLNQTSHHLVTKRLTMENSSLNFGLSWDGSANRYPRNSVFFHSQSDPKLILTTDKDTLPRKAEWIHLVVTFDHGERMVYLDGKLLQRLPRSVATELAKQNTEIIVGASAPQLDRSYACFDGDMDELFILGRVMSAREIDTLYKMEKSNQ